MDENITSNAVVKLKFCNCFIYVHNYFINVTVTATRNSLIGFIVYVGPLWFSFIFRNKNISKRSNPPPDFFTNVSSNTTE